MLTNFWGAAESKELIYTIPNSIRDQYIPKFCCHTTLQTIFPICRQLIPQFRIKNVAFAYNQHKPEMATSSSLLQDAAANGSIKVA